MTGQPMVNTDPPTVRCGMCGSRCRSDGLGSYGPRWIVCRRCPWSSHDRRRAGWWWRLRVWVGA